MIRRKKKECNHPTCDETCRREPKEKKVYRLPRTTIAREGDYERYWPARAEYLQKHPLCECGCGKRSVEIHHKKGRTGKLLYDMTYFMAVARFCHRKITNNPEWAMEKGFTLSRHSNESTNIKTE